MLCYDYALVCEEAMLSLEAIQSNDFLVSTITTIGLTRAICEASKCKGWVHDSITRAVVNILKSLSLRIVLYYVI